MAGDVSRSNKSKDSSGLGQASGSACVQRDDIQGRLSAFAPSRVSARRARPKPTENRQRQHGQRESERDRFGEEVPQISRKVEEIEDLFAYDTSEECNALRDLLSPLMTFKAVFQRLLRRECQQDAHAQSRKQAGQPVCRGRGSSSLRSRRRASGRSS
jgi:hypothetical protein